MDPALFLRVSFRSLVVPRLLVALNSVETVRLLFTLGVPESSLPCGSHTHMLGQEAINILIQVTDQWVEVGEQKHVVDTSKFIWSSKHCESLCCIMTWSFSLQHFLKSIRRHQAPTLFLFFCSESPGRDSGRQDISGRDLG